MSEDSRSTFETNKIVNIDLPTTTDVPYVTSINLENEYMKKTPKIHGIKL